MREQIALFVGLVRKGEFESLVRRGIKVGVIVDANWKMRMADPNAFHVVEYCDFNGAESDLLRVVDRIEREWKINAVLVTHEFYILASATITDYLELPGLTKHVALVCNDKTVMHERFAACIGLHATAKFMKVQSQADLIEFVKHTPFPIVLKPANLAGSLFITLNHSLEELLRNYEDMLGRTAAFFTKAGWNNARPHIQAEEFLVGTTHSIDCIIDAAGNTTTTPVVDELTGREVGWNDFHIFARYIPSRLTESQQEEMHRLARAGIKALEMKSSIAHVEILQTASGPKLLEIGARPGGYRPELYQLSCGIDLIYPYYQVRSGQTPDPLPQYGIVAIANISPGSHKRGILRQVKYLDRFQHLKTYRSHEVKTPVGQLVGPATQGFYAPLGILLRSENPEALYQDLEEVQSLQDIFVVSES